jgi:urease accessory protein UreH
VDSPRSAVRVVGAPERLGARDAGGARCVQARDRRGASAIGRAARLELSFELRGGRTILAHSYAEPPFRIGRTFDLDGAAYLILVCAGPGVFGGDTLRQTVRVAHGGRVVLASQTALQAHPAIPPSCAPAVLVQDYVVEEGAELHCHWDPVIPFAGARLEQRFDVQIAEGSRLYWGDAMMAGRISCGEAWRFESLSHELALRVGGSLRYLERYTLKPSERALERPWIARDIRYIATSLVHHPDATSDDAAAWQRELGDADARVQVGVDLVAPGLIAARMTAAEGAPFGRLRTSYRALALGRIFHSPEFAGRK